MMMMMMMMQMLQQQQQQQQNLLSSSSLADQRRLTPVLQHQPQQQQQMSSLGAMPQNIDQFHTGTVSQYTRWLYLIIYPCACRTWPETCRGDWSFDVAGRRMWNVPLPSHNNKMAMLKRSFPTMHSVTEIFSDMTFTGFLYRISQNGSVFSTNNEYSVPASLPICGFLYASDEGRHLFTETATHGDLF